VRVPGDMKAALKRAAEADERSMSSMVVRIMREWLTEAGYFSVGPDRKPRRRSRQRPRPYPPRTGRRT
jgi:hypothetical protein